MPLSRHLSELAQFVRRSKLHLTLRGPRRMSFQQLPVSIQRKSCNILETLTNLLYLAEMEADDPQRVRVYLALSKERVQAMIQMLTGKEDGGKEQPSFGGDSLRL
jgi:hypothetical protein